MTDLLPVSMGSDHLTNRPRSQWLWDSNGVISHISCRSCEVWLISPKLWWASVLLAAGPGVHSAPPASPPLTRWPAWASPPELVEAQVDGRKCPVCFVLGSERACRHFCSIPLAKASHMAEPKVRDGETYLAFVGGIPKSCEKGHGYRRGEQWGPVMKYTTLPA